MPSPSRGFSCRATALTLSAVAALLLLALAVSSPRLAESVTAEGAVVECLQVLLMAAAGVLAAREGWLAGRAGQPAALQIAIVATILMIVVGELDLDRAVVGTKIISTHFFVNPKYDLGWRALAVLVVAGPPIVVGLWLLARWRQLSDATFAALREPWGQTAAFGVAIYILTQLFERPIDSIPGQPRHFFEETLELISAIWIFGGLAARRRAVPSRFHHALPGERSNLRDEAIVAD
jgi:hypothetical protein